MATEQEQYQQYLKDMQEQEEYQQYLRETGQGEAPAEVQVSEAAHPEGSPVNFLTRFMYKNVLQGTDDKASEKWLKEKQPELDWQIKGGEPYYKKSGESTYYKMDPSDLDIQDITDIVGDVGSGLATSAATGLGFAGGGPLGAMGAGATTSAGIEAARQGIAKGMTGGEFQGTPVAVQGVAGALAPLLFGAGATKNQLAQYAAKKGMTTKAAEQSWQAKGVVSKAVEPVLNKISSAVSGVKERALTGYTKYKPVVDSMIKDPEGDLNYLRPRIQEINKSVDSARTQAGQELGQAIGAAQIKIDQTDVLKPLYQRLGELEKGPLSGMKKNQEAIASLKAEIADISSNLPQQADASTLFELQKYYGKEARWNMSPQAFDALPVSERQDITTFRNMYGVINKTLEDVTGGVSKDLKKKTQNLIELDKLTNKYFRDENAAASFFSGIDRQNNVLQRSTVERVKQLTNGAIDMSKDADIMAAYNIFKSPGLFPMSSQGSTSTGKIMTMLAAGGGAAPYTGGASLPIAALPLLAGPRAMKTYTGAANLAGRAAQKVPGPVRKIPPYLMSNEVLKMMFPTQSNEEEVNQ